MGLFCAVDGKIPPGWKIWSLLLLAVLVGTKSLACGFIVAGIVTNSGSGVCWGDPEGPGVAGAGTTGPDTAW